ncbi:hypothetical protein GCM10012282_68000 [Streptomyces lacrimifluminis]|uniref:Uncharacterized protein n=2 Tax=Streptomyces lacrimifluminis TaxID=1500077 RepID=A0A917UIQ7_9ACTN|nr:hypothetical protein GCM10012282_68000 [Streptomyces lacrimifluminis]
MGGRATPLRVVPAPGVTVALSHRKPSPVTRVLSATWQTASPENVPLQPISAYIARIIHGLGMPLLMASQTIGS